MNHGLLIGTLALMLSTTLQTPGGEPDDPYQWLEEVLGEKPLAWVKERNAESIGELTGSEQFPHARAPHPRDPRFRRSDPGHPEDRPVLLQLLARRQEPARALAAHHARRVPQGQAQLGDRARPRRAGQGGERELGLARRPGAQARVQAGPRLALARRRRRERGPRIRPGHEGVHQGRIHAARGQEPGRLARTGQRVCRHRLRAGLADRVGLSADRQGMEAGHAAGRRPRSSSRPGPTT